MEDFQHFLRVPIATLPLPDLPPIDALPSLTGERIECTFQSSNPKIAAIEAEYRAGDLSHLSSDIDELMREGTSAQYLQTLLLHAANLGDVLVVKKLLSVGVPISTNMISPAIRQRSLELLSLFLEYGWDINREVGWCYPPPLSLALEGETDESVISWFLANGADPDATCRMDITPLSIAVQYAPLSIIETLLEHAGSPWHGQLLHHAAGRTLDDCDAVVRLVLERCRLKVNDIMYLNHAFSFEIRRCVGLGTALHEAARSGSPKAVQVLLGCGADLTARNTCGQTALEVAEASGNQAVAELLRQVQCTREQNGKDEASEGRPLVDDKGTTARGSFHNGKL
ncbi:hypothetical protein LTS09_007415 [Friedmanniomyces endolithicus]|nr:hypothetical protein LTS09_007415 [Friedmanniomyces endolithicus]